MNIVDLGRVMQLAYVPRDFDAAIKRWTKGMGVGPFFYLPHVAIPKAWYRGRPTVLDFSMALAYWGDLQIELIKPHDSSPSIYTDNYAANDGLHHLCINVDDMSLAKAVCERAGATIVQEFALDGGAAIYVDVGNAAGTLIELLQAPPAIEELFTVVRTASREWDGRDPLRTIG